VDPLACPIEDEVKTMRLPLQIAFHNLPPSAEVEDKVRAEAERLDEFHDRIMSGRVVVDVPHRHHKEGNIYRVRIDLKVPGGEVVIKRDPAEHGEYRDLDLAIRDAFDEARRQLEDRARIERGQVKAHEPPPHARVARLFPEAGYGFLETPDGREVYFHEHSVLNGGFRALEVGTEVRFIEEPGEKGAQASAVHPVGRHGGT
jgi:cold shock CspA family protein